CLAEVGRIEQTIECYRKAIALDDSRGVAQRTAAGAAQPGGRCRAAIPLRAASRVVARGRRAAEALPSPAREPARPRSEAAHRLRLAELRAAFGGVLPRRHPREPPSRGLRDHLLFRRVSAG